MDRLSNPLVTSGQLIAFKAKDNPPSTSTLFTTTLLTQTAGMLLRLPQEVIATAIILLQRYLVSNSSLPDNSQIPTLRQSQTLHNLSSASLYLCAKNSFTPVSPRSVINVYAYLLNSKSSPLGFINTDFDSTSTRGSGSGQEYYVSEGDFSRSKLTLFKYESLLLAGIGFDVKVALPYTLALTYISALGVAGSKGLITRVFAHLNAALLSPQLLYLTHQPNALAVAAIYLSAREVGVKLVSGVNWWEVFDVDREGLGFCVMALGSLSNFAEAEAEKWKTMTTDSG